MKNSLLHLAVAVLVAALFCWGCSGNSGEEAEKGAIREMTDEVAHDLADRIRSPINKARAAKDQEQNRLDDWEDTAEESSRVD